MPPALLPAFVGARYLIDRQPPSLYQAVAAEFLRQGHFVAHIRRMRVLYREQRDALAATLNRRAPGHLKIEVPDQGMHLIAYLENDVSDIQIETAARRARIVVRAMNRSYRRAPPKPALMLGFSGFPRQIIIPAAARLAALIEKPDTTTRRVA